MVLYALDEGVLTFAADGVLWREYICLECGGRLRLRTGRSKQAHFYHLPTTAPCRLYSRSQRHISVQLYLQSLLPPGETQLEHPFPSICRVADLFWEAEKIVFEVQCSNISEMEVLWRMRDYRALGFDVVWILDDRLYNKRRLRSAEKLLRSHWSYFAAISKATLSVSFYDQFEFLTEKKRRFQGRFSPVDFHRGVYKNTPTHVGERIKYFRGDHIDPSLAHIRSEEKEKIENINKLFLRKEKIQKVRDPLSHYYLTLFHRMLPFLDL